MFCCRRKLQVKLNEYEQQLESVSNKVSALEKAKSRLQGELEDALIDVQRVMKHLFKNVFIMN